MVSWRELAISLNGKRENQLRLEIKVKSKHLIAVQEIREKLVQFDMPFWLIIRMNGLAI